ncbi:4-hydroxy-tetrahydrodipicolinate reductase [Alienimonas californiensis]|uniref:4-hydroxy-tetrahydrodipicolinate reductase n=1 Tax=Alienimonas californiensis TaxID=2527989 RepID=A0A517PEW5_9PLAN|nr:4-hydroxy-tetrahydrodipicolinate reductase [Alienimonas californiensis]QDT17916.1 4-hydroxy-tetrahydrodipicolinate reductase [Alienimonas californiensis]
MTSPPLRIAVHGASGRMGRRVVAGVMAAENVTLAAALDHSDSPHLGVDAGELAGEGPAGVPITERFGDAQCDAVIDFSTPDGLIGVLTSCVKRNLPIAVATTGLSDSQMDAVRTAAESVPIVFAPSFSTAVNVAMRLTAIAAAALKDVPGGADVEIVERHHRYKEDAPSGTALRFAEIVRGVMGQDEFAHGRSGRPGARPHGEIGLHAVREGDNVGEHSILFGMLGETLEIAVRGRTRDSYANGSIAAARWAVGRPPGLYGMDEVLGLK